MVMCRCYISSGRTNTLSVENMSIQELIQFLPGKTCWLWEKDLLGVILEDLPCYRNSHKRMPVCSLWLSVLQIKHSLRAKLTFSFLQNITSKWWPNRDWFVYYRCLVWCVFYKSWCVLQVCALFSVLCMDIQYLVQWSYVL